MAQIPRVTDIVTQSEVSHKQLSNSGEEKYKPYKIKLCDTVAEKYKLLELFVF